MIQNNLEKYTIQLPKKLNFVLKKIDSNSNGIVFITNLENKLIGSLSDGDIRRGEISLRALGGIVRPRGLRKETLPQTAGSPDLFLAFFFSNGKEQSPKGFRLPD